MNSLLYAGVGSLLHTGVACLMAYLAAKFKYKFSKIIYWTVVILLHENVLEVVWRSVFLEGII